MSNLTNPYRTWKLDTTGIITTVPVRIRRITYKPGSSGDQVIFYEWFVSDTPTLAVTNASLTANAQTMTSTGNFTSATVNPGQVIVITKTETGNNEDTFLITTNADNNTIVVASAQDPTEESTKVYNYDIYEAREAIRYMSVGSDQVEVVAEFNERAGRFFQNLALVTLSSGQVNIDIA